MGAWYVLATLGVYPVAGSDLWVLGAPRFPQARITLGGHELSILRKGTGIHVQAVTLDGAELHGSITHAQLVAGQQLVFQMTE
jgi:putative alpha-1,2-mannosidase